MNKDIIFKVIVGFVGLLSLMAIIVIGGLGPKRVELNANDVLLVIVGEQTQYQTLTFSEANNNPVDYVEIDDTWFHVVGENEDELNLYVRMSNIIVWGIDR